MGTDGRGRRVLGMDVKRGHVWLRAQIMPYVYICTYGVFSKLTWVAVWCCFWWSDEEKWQTSAVTEGRKRSDTVSCILAELLINKFWWFWLNELNLFSHNYEILQLWGTKDAIVLKHRGHIDTEGNFSQLVLVLVRLDRHLLKLNLSFNQLLWTCSSDGPSPVSSCLIQTKLTVSRRNRTFRRFLAWRRSSADFWQAAMRMCRSQSPWPFHH